VTYIAAVALVQRVDCGLHAPAVAATVSEEVHLGEAHPAEAVADVGEPRDVRLLLYGRISDLFITHENMVYAIDSESNELRHINWRNGVRIGPVDRDWIVGFIPPWESDSRPQNGVAGEGVAVDAEGNVFVAEGPASLSDAGSAFTKYEVAGI
jgi:hypothetical protein